MACKSCGQRKTNNQVQQQDPAVDFTLLSTNRSTIKIGRNNYSIRSPLTKIKPPTGYTIPIKVKGKIHTVEGNNAQMVVESIILIYNLNEITITENSAWLNANIFWLSKLSVKHAIVNREELIAFAKQEVTPFTKPKPVVLDDPSPADWGGSAWSFLGAYIAQAQNVDYDTLNKIFDTFHTMLGDPFIGCPDCLEHFEDNRLSFNEIDTNKDGQISNLEAAKWMFNTMNSIRISQNRPTISWQEAVTTHRWENL